MRTPYFLCGTATPTPNLGLENSGLQTPALTPALEKPGLQFQAQNETVTMTLGLIV